jgi:BirA family transcriptional regulator, biotin operon repressor / biotin---[acetyl-CoA-carboxylase] ligase
VPGPKATDGRQATDTSKTRGPSAARTRGASPRVGAPKDSDASLVARVFAELADGAFHSGEALAESLGVTRGAVWRAAKSLRGLGATLHAVRNRGYRLASGGEPLSAAKIREHLARGVRERLGQLDVFWSTGSTNTVLLDRPNPTPGSFYVALAECQTAGRGRRGRTWVAPPGGAICLSLSWTFREVPADLGALGLVVGVCSLHALASVGVEGARLKWPNDLLVDDRKLGGVLIELRAETTGPACVVIGIGLNVALGNVLIEKIAETGLAPIDLVTAGVASPSRNRIAAALVSSYVRGLLDFEREGLKPFIEEWRHADALRGRPVTVQAMDGVTKGLARGIDLHGAFLVETPHGLKRFISGDVSVRPT